jgi:hypothetical protein
MTKKTTKKPSTEALVKAETKVVSTLQQTADRLVVSDQSSCQKAADFLNELKARRDDWDAQRKEVTQPMDVAKKAVMSMFKGPASVLTGAINTVDTKILGWTRAEQERARKEAEKKAKKEAAKLQKKGATKAEAAQVAEDIVRTKVEEAKPDINGMKTKTTWAAEVEDLIALAKAVGEGKAPPECIKPNGPFLNGLARLHKDTGTPPAGVKFVSSEHTSR